MNHERRGPVNVEAPAAAGALEVPRLPGVRRVPWIGALVAPVAIAIWLVSSSLDAVAARAIERRGSELTGVADARGCSNVQAQ